MKMLHAYYATRSEVLKSQSYTDASAGWKRQIELLRILHPVLWMFYLQAQDKLGLQQHGHLCKPSQHVHAHTTGTERKQKRLHRITITFRELRWPIL
jgi:hypothetical protein